MPFIPLPDHFAPWYSLLFEIITDLHIHLSLFCLPHLNTRTRLAATLPGLCVAVSLVLEETLVHSRCSKNICLKEQMASVQYIHKALSTLFLLKTYSNS